MHKPVVFLVLVALGTLAAAQAKPGSIGPSAVWQPAPGFFANAQAMCAKSAQPAPLGECLMNQMQTAGASADAVKFTRDLYKVNGGQVGIMSGFHKVGPVDIAFINYPSTSSNGLLLVNGKPGIINVEDMRLLDQKGLQQSFQFQDLKNQFPQVGVFPGDRDGKTWPNSSTGSNGGLQFIVGYPLRNGCPTCAHAGFALFTWNFNPDGRFVGTSFLGLTPAPLKPPSSGTPQQ